MLYQLDWLFLQVILLSVGFRWFPLVSEITHVMFYKNLFFDAKTILCLHDELLDAVCVTYLPTG